MHNVFLPIGEAHFDAWRSHRLFSACRAFAAHLDPDMTAQAFYDNHQRQGWTFVLSSAEAGDRLAWFCEQIMPSVEAERTTRHHPVEVGAHDAATAIHAR